MNEDDYSIEQAMSDAGMKNILQAVMGVAGISTFFYYPQKHIALTSQENAESINCDACMDCPAGVAEACVHPDCRNEFYRPYRELERGAKKAISEYYNLDRSKFFRTTLLPMQYDAAGRAELVLGITEDLTQVKRREEQKRLELAELSAEFQKAKSSKNIFLNCISMNVRKPLKKIITMARQAEESPAIKDDVKEGLQGIIQDGKRIMGQLNEVLDMNRLENGRIMLEEGPCSLYWVMQDVSKLMEPSLRTKDLTLEIVTDHVQNDGVICDKLRIQQILMNMLEFFVQHVQNDETIKLSLVQRKNSASKKSEFSFILQGITEVLPLEELRCLFDPYQGAAVSAIGSMKGTSLGMPIAAKLIELMQGTLQATSKADEGTVITIDLSFSLASN